VWGVVNVNVNVENVNLMVPQCQDQRKKWKKLWVKMVVAPIQRLDLALLYCDLCCGEWRIREESRETL